MMKHNKKLLSLILTLALVLSVFSPLGSVSANTAASDSTKATSATEGFANYIKNTANQFVVIKHKQLGGSHYAYTEALSDSRGLDQPNGDEYNFRPGSEMVLLTYDENNVNTKTEETLISTTTGVLRDPDVSSDGKKVLYSYKKNENDDFHLYEMDLETRESTQLTFGQGIADTEGKYLPSGKIVFSSSRDIQTIDCWKTPISNLYTCDADGSNIVRLGYDQVHTTYPTVTSDGRVLYTRWDYNDRNQNFIQAVFQMFPDGTNQTEVYGNNSNWPTTLLHTVEVPGQPGKYYSIASGHHVYECGKLSVIDTTVDRNEYTGDNEYAITLLDEKASGATYVNGTQDKYGQTGWVYKYPIGISDNELLVSMTKNPGGGDGYINASAQFGIYYTFINENNTCEYIEMSGYNSKLQAGASQIVPIPKTEETLYEKPSSVNYAENTGVYYVGNVYEGEAVEGIKGPTYDENGNVTKAGEVAQLRVVALEFRSSAIGYTGQGNNTGGKDYGGWGNPYTPVSTGNGSWDVKQVLGVVDVEADGSAMFKVPSETPVYFQLLNSDGEVLQTMRSWSTLMPNETFSCVGCHENKNSVPPSESTPTLAMKKGVQELKSESWMEKETSNYKNNDPYSEKVGFSYMTEVQTIFDNSCVSCHNNTNTAYGKIGYTSDSATIVDEREKWEYTTSAPTSNTKYASDYAPFGTLGTDPQELNTVISSNKLYLKKTFTVTDFQLETYDFQLSTILTGSASIKVNGTAITYDALKVEIPKNLLKKGENTIEVEVTQTSDKKMYFDASITAMDLTSVYWYSNDYDTSAWKTSTGGGFGGDWGSTKYSSKDLAIKKSFTLTQNQIDNLSMSINIKYDEDPYVYINGNLVWSVSGYYDSGYKNVNLTSKAKDYLVAGENYISVSVTNNTGGKGLDLDLVVNNETLIAKGASGWSYYDGVPSKQGSKSDLIPRGSAWKYTFSNPGSNWYSESFSDSSWSQGNGVFGSDGSCSTSWSGTGSNTNIWIRKTFEIGTQEDLNKLKNSTVNMSLFYDENPHVYVNGTEIFTTTGYNGGYGSFDITENILKVLKVGTNTIAVSAVNTSGGAYLDLGINAIEDSDIPVSLESTLITNSTMQRDFPVSYLLLTGSGYSGENNGSPNADTDGPRDNGYTTWISSQGGAEIRQAKQYGSINSNIVQLLQDNHQNLLSSGKITDADIRAIAAWIDLCVPLCGTYDELNAWGGNSTREYQEKLNKRTYYNDMNDASRAALAGTVENNGELTISYRTGGTVVGTATGTGTVQLNVASDLKAGDQVTIELPKGQNYVAFRLDPRFKESIVYCPSGTFSYIVPADAAKVFPKVLQSDQNYRFYNLTMAARIPSENELAETRNLAVNPYDVTSGNAFYPHVTTSSNYNNQAEFCGRNAIDGFTMNQGHGEYPYQSWGPALGDNQWFNIDFGRTVNVEKVVVYTRADFPHDTNYVSGTLEFSDGTEKEVSFYQTADGIEFELDKAVNTTYVKIKNLKTAANNWAGFAEVEVYGSEATDAVDESVPATGITLDKTSATLKSGETLSLNATIAPANATNKKITWTSSDYGIASVDTNGVVTATGNGKATITAKTSNGKTATCDVTVSTPVTSIKLSSYNVSNRSTGDTFKLVATVSPTTAENKTVEWISSDPNIVSIDQEGNATCLSQGKATIIAVATDGSGVKSSTCTVNVTKGLPIGITLTLADATVSVGSTTQMKAVFEPATVTSTLKWTSSDTSVATVSSTGVVTGVKTGTATITVTSDNGLTASAKVTVTAAQKPSNGPTTQNGKTVLYVNGKLVTGTQVVTAAGKTYAVVGGYVKTGKTQVVTISGKSYIVNTSGVVQKGTKNKLIKVGSKSYIVNKSGVIIKSSKNKLVKVGSKSYIVNKKGVVIKGKKNKLVKVGKKKYVVNKKGVVQKNKKKIKVGKKTYKTNKKGVAKLKK